MLATAPEFEVEERTVPQMDRVCGVARRWSVRHARSGTMRLVILTLAGWEVGGREGRYLCSCGLATAGRPCDHVHAVVATLPAEPPAAA
jgi:hypothetical protein